MKWASILLPALSAFLFPGCSGDGNSLAGATSETTNGIVAMAEGKPAAGAKIRIVSPDFWENENAVIDSVVADTNGVFNLDSVVLADNYIQIDHADGAVILRDGVPEKGDTIALPIPGKYSGVIQENAFAVENLAIVGTAYRANVNEFGAFDFGTVAPGVYSVLVKVGRGDTAHYALNTALSIGPEDQVIDASVNTDPSIVPLDRFDASFGLTTLGYLVDDIVWYYYSDSVSRRYDRRTDSWVSADLVHGEWAGSSYISVERVPGKTFGGKLRAESVLDSTARYPYAGVGVLFAADGEVVPMDLSKMSHLSMVVSGKGLVEVRLESTLLDSAGVNRHYSDKIWLTETEQRVRISTDGLRMEPFDSTAAAQFPWERASRSINRIEFEFSFRNNPKGEYLWMNCDDISFEGIRIEEVLRNAP